MPVRNGGSLLGPALRSVLDQSERDLEIIVSDNGSDDGSSEVLQAAAAADPRIRYVRQQPALRAYDNFQFVLREARGRYFMWAAHDDTRDHDFIARLADGLDANLSAVLAFGDLIIVTPDDPQGRAQPYPFATTGLARARRLAKVSRFPCYHIYGLWRADAIKRVPSSYCDWWADLPLMLGAAAQGTFLHVAGPQFRYFEIQKSGAERARTQDYAVRFSLVRSVVDLVRATYRASTGAAGPLTGAYAAGLVVCKQAVGLPGFLGRRVMRRLAARS